jgi:hypothetical protein
MSNSAVAVAASPARAFTGASPSSDRCPGTR